MFGHPAQLHKLKSIAKKNKLYLIEDNAQAPLATEKNNYCGTIGDIGVFSLNYHKHIHSGEGGICCTNDDELALKMQLIRNHAEASVEFTDLHDLTNMVGFNYRMTELSGALIQLKNIKKHVRLRKDFSESLSAQVKNLDGLSVPYVRNGCEHVYYGWVLGFDEKKLGIKERFICQSIKRRGFSVLRGIC